MLPWTWNYIVPALVSATDSWYALSYESGPVACYVQNWLLKVWIRLDVSVGFLEQEMAHHRTAQNRRTRTYILNSIRIRTHDPSVWAGQDRTRLGLHSHQCCPRVCVKWESSVAIQDRRVSDVVRDEIRHRRSTTGENDETERGRWSRRCGQ
jgi:hypothetical protein